LMTASGETRAGSLRYERRSSKGGRRVVMNTTMTMAV
jgi:hypothetical protein